MKTIALCFNTPGMSEREFIRKDYGKRFPGAGWMRHLVALTQKREIQVTDGKSAFELNLNPLTTVNVQEELNPYGLQLHQRGAKKNVAICMESPIFASEFYDQMEELLSISDHALFFENGTEHLYFPSFDIEDIQDAGSIPFKERKFICMVASNKHYSHFWGAKQNSPTFKRSMETQLHDFRYLAANYFLDRGLHLYGRGWGNKAPECADKIETIRQYKFALCFENGSYPGYITEKIIDCFVAGVVPVYAGAPDVANYIPPELFIAAKDFASFEALEEYLIKYGHVGWSERIQSAWKWLRSEEGLKYSNLQFAKHLLELCE